MAERVCGNCTACCKTHQVLSIKKPAGEWCQHCQIGVGCKIYASRPNECQIFECQWLKGYGADNERPDITNVVIDYCRTRITGNKKIVSLWEIKTGSLESDFVKREAEKMLQAGICVLKVTLGGERQILHLARKKTLSRKQVRDLTKARIEITPYFP